MVQEEEENYSIRKICNWRHHAKNDTRNFVVKQNINGFSCIMFQNKR